MHFVRDTSKILKVSFDAKTRPIVDSKEMQIQSNVVGLSGFHPVDGNFIPGK